MTPATWIVAAMQAKNIPVTWVLFPDDGHGFARPENSKAFNAVAEGFLWRLPGQSIAADRRRLRRLQHHGTDRSRERTRRGVGTGGAQHGGKDPGGPGGASNRNATTP